jgi:hypothetical protein
MSTRAAIRPRPLDINKPLLIVRELSELDPDAQQLGADTGGHGGHVSYHRLFLQQFPLLRSCAATPRRQYNDRCCSTTIVISRTAVLFMHIWLDGQPSQEVLHKRDFSAMLVQQASKQATQAVHDNSGALAHTAIASQTS